MRTTGRQTALFGALAAALGLRAVHALGSGWNCGTSPHQPGPFQLWMNEFHHNGDAEDSTEVVALSALNTTLSRVDMVTVAANGSVMRRGHLSDCAAPVRVAGTGTVPSVDLVVCSGFLADGLASLTERGGVALVDNRGTPADDSDDVTLQFVINRQGANDSDVTLYGTPGCPLPAEQSQHVTSPSGTSLQLNGVLRYDPASRTISPYASEWQGFLPQTLGAMNTGGSIWSDFTQTYTAATLGEAPVPAPNPDNLPVIGVTATPSPSPAVSANTCANSLVDHGESGIDCGGNTSCERCGMGRGCGSSDDCDRGSADDLTCYQAVCLPMAITEAPFLVTLAATLSGADATELTAAAIEVIRQILATAASGSGSALPVANTTISNILFTPAGRRRLLGAFDFKPRLSGRALGAAGDTLVLDLTVPAYSSAEASATSSSLGSQANAMSSSMTTALRPFMPGLSTVDIGQATIKAVSTVGPAPTSVPVTPSTEPSSGGLSGGAIAGIVIGGLVGLVLIAAVGVAAAAKIRDMSSRPVLSSQQRNTVAIGAASTAGRDPTHAAEIEQAEKIKRRQKAAFEPTAANIEKSKSEQDQAAEQAVPAAASSLKPETMHEASASTSVSGAVPSEPKTSPIESVSDKS